MALRILSIVLPVFLIALLGYVYGRFKRPDMSVVNRINMDVFVPALVFYALSRKDFTFAHYSRAALAAAIVVLGSGVLAYPAARAMKVGWRTFVPPMMFTNAGNLGLPLIVLAFGDKALSIAVIFLIVENILQFTLGRYLLDHTVRPWRVLASPVVLATLAGLAFSFLHLELPPALALPVEMVGNISIPLLLFSLGVRLLDIDWGQWNIGLISALVCPATGIAVALITAAVLGLPDLQARQLLLFGALPPAVLNYLFAEQYRQEPEKVASIVLIGNLAAVVTIPAALYWLL
ncbi:MAG: AEC family transporter [Arenicellales bacterium]